MVTLFITRRVRIGRGVRHSSHYHHGFQGIAHARIRDFGQAGKAHLEIFSSQIGDTSTFADAGIIRPCSTAEYIGKNPRLIVDFYLSPRLLRILFSRRNERI
jgi:hypothetical protein